MTELYDLKVWQWVAIVIVACSLLGWYQSDHASSAPDPYQSCLEGTGPCTGDQ